MEKPQVEGTLLSVYHEAQSLLQRRGLWQPRLKGPSQSMESGSRSSAVKAAGVRVCVCVRPWNLGRSGNQLRGDAYLQPSVRAEKSHGPRAQWPRGSGTGATAGPRSASGPEGGGEAVSLQAAPLAEAHTAGATGTCAGIGPATCGSRADPGSSGSGSSTPRVPPLSPGSGKGPPGGHGPTHPRAPIRASRALASTSKRGGTWHPCALPDSTLRVFPAPGPTAPQETDGSTGQWQDAKRQLCVRPPLSASARGFRPSPAFRVGRPLLAARGRTRSAAILSVAKVAPRSPSAATPACLPTGRTAQPDSRPRGRQEGSDAASRGRSWELGGRATPRLPSATPS